MVERAGLENRCTRKGIQGSNPCLSANWSSRRKGGIAPIPTAVGAVALFYRKRNRNVFSYPSHLSGTTASGKIFPRELPHFEIISSQT